MKKKTVTKIIVALYLFVAVGAGFLYLIGKFPGQNAAAEEVKEKKDSEYGIQRLSADESESVEDIRVAQREKDSEKGFFVETSPTVTPKREETENADIEAETDDIDEDDIDEDDIVEDDIDADEIDEDDIDEDDIEADDANADDIGADDADADDVNANDIKDANDGSQNIEEQNDISQNVEEQNADAQDMEDQNEASQNVKEQNEASQNVKEQNEVSQNAEEQNEVSQNAEEQNDVSQAVNEQNAEGQEKEQQNSDVQGIKFVTNVKTFLNVRKEPSKESDLIGKLGANDQGYVLEEGKEFSLISCGDLTGYVSNVYILTGDAAETKLNTVEKEKTASVMGTVKIVSDCYARSGPSTSNEIITTVWHDSEYPRVPEAETKSGWYAIQLDGRVAFVSVGFAKLLK